MTERESKDRAWPFLIGSILVLALILRLVGIDHGPSLHPDEQGIAAALSAPESETPPPGLLRYGTLPVSLLSTTVKAVEPGDTSLEPQQTVPRAERILAAIFGVLGVFFTFRLAYLIYGNQIAATLAGLLLTMNILHLQGSHFYTPDIISSSLTLVTLYAIILAQKRSSGLLFLMSGFLIAATSAVSVFGVILWIPLLVTIFFQTQPRNRLVDGTTLLLVTIAMIGFAVGIPLCEPLIVSAPSQLWTTRVQQLHSLYSAATQPGTLFYANLPPYLGPLKQIFVSGLGWPLWIFVFAGMAARISIPDPDSWSAERTVLVWAGAFFLIVGKATVQPPLQMLPLYPIFLIVLAGSLALLCEKLRHLDRMPLLLTGLSVLIAASSVYGFAYVNILTHPHTAITASEWIYSSLPAGSRILQSVDETRLPLPVDAGKTSQNFEISDPHFFDEDLEMISERLAQADYLIFYGNRSLHSLFRNPERFYEQGLLLRMLFAEKLGYTLLQKFDDGGRLFGWKVSNNRDNPLYTDYDRPAILIFQNSQRLPASDMAKIVRENLAVATLPSGDHLFDYAGTSIPGAVRIGQADNFLPIVAWFLFIELAAFAVLPLLRFMLPEAPDYGWGLARPLGILLVGYISWLGASLKLFPITQNSIITVLAIMLILAHCMIMYSSEGNWASFLRTTWDQYRTSLLLYLCALFIFTLIQAYHPAIFWGEKPMDFTFLNYFVRLETMPPDDPWAAGSRMHYYYFGTYLCAILHKVSGVDSAFGFNLCIITLPALMIGSCFAVLLRITRRKGIALCGALAVPMMSNLEVVKVWLFDGKKLNFDLFWASSRLYKEPGITEYPIWTYLFADLHAHLIALPFSVVALGFALELVHSGDFLGGTQQRISPSRASVVVHRIVYGLLLGSLFMINSWDFISYGLLTALMLWRGASITREGASSDWSAYLLRLARNFVQGLCILFAALILIAPYMIDSGSHDRVGMGLVTRGEFSSISMVLRLLGQWLLPILFICWLLLLRPHAGRPSPWETIGKGVRALGAGLAPLMPVAYSAYHGTPLTDFPWSILLFVTALSILLSLLASMHSRSFGIQSAATLAHTGCILICFAEVIYVMDRANTLFKFYNAIWVMVGMACCALLSRAFDRSHSTNRLASPSFTGYLAWFSGLIFTFGLLYYLAGNDRGRPFEITPDYLALALCWIGLALLSLIAMLLFYRKTRDSGGRSFLHPLSAALTSQLFLLGLLGTIGNVKVMTTEPRIDGPRPTLDGLAYLQHSNPSEYVVIKWIRGHISGTPTLLEAHGDPYREFSRATMHTGLPIVMGWSYHVSQRGTHHQEINRRELDVATIYNTSDLALTVNLLNKYGVKLILVGKNERDKYNRAGIQKFKMFPQLFPVLYELGDVALYSTAGALNAMQQGETLQIAW